MNWIDTHVHLFSKKAENENVPLVYSRGKINSPELYFELLGSNKPAGIVVVDFSKSKDSQHVIDALDDLKNQNIPAAGVIKGNLDDARTYEWMQRDDIKGVRLYAKDKTPDLSGEKWSAFFEKIRENGQHILVFGAGEYLLGLVEQIPADIIILVDHLGLPAIFGESEDENYNKLLSFAASRGNVYFKGPGYRTSLDVNKVSVIIKKIVEKLGAEKLLLGASDGPFAGPVLDPAPEYEGKKFGEVIDYDKVIKFIENLASTALNEQEKKDALHNNAKALYGF